MSLGLQVSKKKSLNKIKGSDAVALFLKKKKIKYAFGIIGSANSHIFDSVNKLKYTKIINVHHEQAATMAMQSYYRINGNPCACLVTAGAGSSNSITGVISAWADSIPGIIISGQEKTIAIKSYKGMRMWGVQGFDSTLMVKKITKYSKRVFKPEDLEFELNKAYEISINGRPGPVWIDVPIDVQGSTYKLRGSSKRDFKIKQKFNIKSSSIDSFYKELKKAKRPVFWFGSGIKLSGAQKLVPKLLNKIPIPFFLGWSAIDLITSSHKLNFGRPGVYGNRASNLILQSSDLIISIGARMSIPMVGYVMDEFARYAKLIQVDIDKSEFSRFKKKSKLSFISDAKYFIEKVLRFKKKYMISAQNKSWINYCSKILKKYPHLEKDANKDKNGYINSYNFLEKFSSDLRPNDCIVTDMGTALLSGHQIMKLKSKQLMITSQGLGEMGFGLPGAIGASFARNKGEVICLNCDGGIMMNLQELQTVDHYKLPIKIFIFNNDGYLMIKHTQKNFFSGRYSSVNKKTGITCPDFKKLAKAFNMKYFKIKSWTDYKIFMKKNFKKKVPMICEVFMDPEQYFYPKLSTFIDKSGNIVSPPLEDLSPMLKREELSRSLLIPVHKKSKLF